MTLRYGLDIDYADEHPSRRPEHLHVVAAIVGSPGSTGTAANLALYKETDVSNVGSRYLATSDLGIAISMFEAIEDITLVILPKKTAFVAADFNRLLAAENELALDAHPDVIIAPNLFNAASAVQALLGNLRSVAKTMRAKIITDGFAGTSPTDAKTWATNNLAAPHGDIQRVRATPNTVSWSGGSTTPGSILLGAMTALVQNDELGEDVMNRVLPLITGVAPAYSFDIEDASTQGQDLANAYLTPIVSVAGTFRFWGRKVASGERGDAGFQWVLEDAIRGLKKFFTNYAGRNQSPGELTLQCSIYNERLQERVKQRQLFAAACIPDPRYGNGSGVDVANDSAYVLLALQKTPSSDKFVFSVDTNTGAVEALEGL